MALDKSRLGLENQFLEKKSGRIFCIRQVYFTKLANKCGGVWTNLLHFLYITSEVKQYYLSHRPRTECGISQFYNFSSQVALSQYSGRSMVGFYYVYFFYLRVL